MEKKSFIRELIETIVVVTFLVVVIRGFVGEPRWIPSASMRTTLLEGDRVFIEKITTKYNFREIKRGDILVFYPPFSELRPGLLGFLTKMKLILKELLIPKEKHLK